MPSLSELQRGFAGATIFGDNAALAGLGIVAAGLDPKTRIGVYRNNIFGNYRKALAATYPVIRRLVGPAFFDAAIDGLVRGYPSRRGDVNRYGADLPRFLADYPAAKTLAYLPDVARLEWAVDQAGIAADAPALETAALATVPVEMWGELRFLLHPSVRLIESSYPILHIWRVNQPDAEDQTVDLGEGGDRLLVQRTGQAVVIERLDAGEHALLTALIAEVKLADASRRADAADSAFDLAGALQRYVAAQTIVAFRAPDLAQGPRR